MLGSSADIFVCDFLGNQPCQAWSISGRPYEASRDLFPQSLCPRSKEGRRSSCVWAEWGLVQPQNTKNILGVNLDPWPN